MRIPISFQRNSLSFCAAIFGWGGAHVSSTAIQRVCVCGTSDSRGVATGRVISAAILRFSTYLDGEKWLLRKRQFSSRVKKSRVVVPEVRKKGSAHLTIAANSPISANDCESGRCSHFRQYDRVRVAGLVSRLFRYNNSRRQSTLECALHAPHFLLAGRKRVKSDQRRGQKRPTSASARRSIWSRPQPRFSLTLWSQGTKPRSAPLRSIQAASSAAKSRGVTVDRANDSRQAT